MLLRAPCPGPAGGIRGTGRAAGTGCTVPGQCAGTRAAAPRPHLRTWWSTAASRCLFPAQRLV